MGSRVRQSESGRKSGSIHLETVNFFEDLILVQDERWRRALSMQVERFSQEDSGGRVSNA